VKPRWLSKQALLLLHEESLAEHGGARGLRDEGLLESELARPLDLAAYDSPDLAELAACYGVGLAKNHAFVDGNKRAAFLAVGLFLALNRKRLLATRLEAAQPSPPANLTRLASRRGFAHICVRPPDPSSEPDDAQRRRTRGT